MTEDPITSASGAGREDARPAPLPVSDGTLPSVVSYLLDAPESLKAWAEEQLEAIDPDGAVAARVEKERKDEAITVPATAAKKESGFPWKGIALGAALLAVVFGVWYMGIPKDETPSPGAVPTMGEVPVFEVDEERAAELEAQIEADPTDLDAMRELAQLYFDAGDWPRATTWLIRVVEEDPNDTDARLILGVTHLNVGNVSQAIVQWREVTEIDPDEPIAYYNLGFAYLSQDDREAAEEAWTRFLELDPDSPNAETIRTHLDGLASQS